MAFDLKKAASEKTIVVAHRGVFGGNIPCNTIASYEIALAQGADMIETDVNITRDGVLIVFHPGMEKAHLNLDVKLTDMTWHEVKELRYVNIDNVPTQFGICRFDDFLEHFKDRCFINVDKFWGNPEAIHEAVKRHGMTDQILVKSALSERVIRVLEELAPELCFMPIVTKVFPEHGEMMRRNINYIGAEVLFDTDTDEVATQEFISRMHSDGKLVWANAIIYNYRRQLSAGHSDDTSLTESPDKGWGWLADRGFDIIQTDWPGMLTDYLSKTGKM